MMVSRPMRSWRLGLLRARADALVSKLETEPERSHAQHLLARISEFEELQDRFIESLDDALVEETLDSGAVNSGITPLASADTRYDGSGWLVPVHSPRQTAPPFALLDDQGDVLQYVSPAPGLNLHRYVRKQVGIYGQRNFVQPLKKTLLTAERVIDLDRHRR